MTITLTPDIERMLTQKAEKTGTTRRLWRWRNCAPVDYRATLPPPLNEWQRELRSIGVPCGVSLTDEQVSRESLYDDHL